MIQLLLGDEKDKIKELSHGVFPPSYLLVGPQLVYFMDIRRHVDG